MKKVVKIVSYLLIVVFIISFTTFSIVLAITQSVNLDLSKLKQNESTLVLCYKNGDEIKRTNNSSYVSFDKIPDHVINALIAIEDKRFYKHSGVDLKSIFRALKNNVFTKKPKQGGSTITQQLVKNTYLNGEKTINRKLKEMRLAVEIERKLSKEQILEAYLNTVYFGEGAYGIASASEKFFRKQVSNLSIEEGATLIACLKAPNLYSPYKNFEKSTQRKGVILYEMYKQGYIDYSQYEKAKNAEIIINYDTYYENDNTLYNEVLSEALSILNTNSVSDLNGYKIYTNVDKNYINMIPNISKYGLSCDYSVLITDNADGKILAYKTNVGSIKRCPASTAKPWLIYSPAIEEDLICPATKILDEQTNFDGYKPSNYNQKYYGYVSVKDCLVRSLNVPSIKIGSMLGLDKIKYYAQKLNVDYTNEDLSIAIGNLSGGITLQELSDAYSVFTNNGGYRKSCLIDKIVNSKGKEIYKSNYLTKQVFSESTTFLINDMLKSCAKYGTASRLSDLNYEICAKTGTNGNEKGNLDAYCIAYTTSHTISVWLGYADGSLMSNSITGGNYPTQIVKDVCENLYKNYTPKNFSIPKTVKEISIDKDYYVNDSKIYYNSGKENFKHTPKSLFY